MKKISSTPSGHNKTRGPKAILKRKDIQDVCEMIARKEIEIKQGAMLLGIDYSMMRYHLLKEGYRPTHLYKQSRTWRKVAEYFPGTLSVDMRQRMMREALEDSFDPKKPRPKKTPEQALLEDAAPVEPQMEGVTERVLDIKEDDMAVIVPTAPEIHISQDATDDEILELVGNLKQAYRLLDEMGQVVKRSVDQATLAQAEATAHAQMLMEAARRVRELEARNQELRQENDALRTDAEYGRQQRYINNRIQLRETGKMFKEKLVEASTLLHPPKNPPQE